MRTIEVRGEDGFEVRGVDRAESLSPKEYLFQGIACLAEMEQEKLHQP